MTWNQDYRLHSVRFNPQRDGGEQPLVISGITSASVNPNADILREVTSGEIYANTAVLQTMRFVGSFTTQNLAQVLGTNGPGINAGSASCITSSPGNGTGLDLYFARQGCAGPSSVDTHVQYNIAAGVIVPTTMTVDHRGNAEISYDIYARSVDGASPVTKVSLANNALPTLAGNDLRWTLNQMWINGVLTEGKRSISINFNANVLQEGADSDTFDSVVSVDSMLQRIVVTGVNPDWLDNGTSNDGVSAIFGEQVTEGDAADPDAAGTFSFFLKERNSDTTATEHIFLGANGLLNWENIVSGDPRSPAQTALAIDVTNPSTATAPIVYSTGVAIPALPTP
tara:strand:+ start:498 stop:1517 length:1020 start_codon:yes stop_codon:yes gene_type:complete